MPRKSRYSPEGRERAVRICRGPRRSTSPSDRAITPLGEKLGMSSETASGSGSAGPRWLRAAGPGSPPTSWHAYPSPTTSAATSMMTVSANKSRSHEFMPQNGRTEGTTSDNYLPISTVEMRSQTP